jgi:predicted signal transduction protein with EAL and GGDEF domain
LEDTERNLYSLRELKKLGISIALDDFGVGYSSLAYLTKFPFDKVSIDKSFIDALDRRRPAPSFAHRGARQVAEPCDPRRRYRNGGAAHAKRFFFQVPSPAMVELRRGRAL